MIQEGETKQSLTPNQQRAQVSRAGQVSPTPRLRRLVSSCSELLLTLVETDTMGLIACIGAAATMITRFVVSPLPEKREDSQLIDGLRWGQVPDLRLDCSVRGRFEYYKHEGVDDQDDKGQWAVFG